MAKDGSQMTEKILNLTLEFIYLLTGERCAVVKMAAMEALLQGMYPPMSRKQISITAPPPRSRTPKRNNQKKILEVTGKMIELLTRENVSIFFSMEEPAYVGHKDTMMGDQTLPPAPVRSPRPFYSQHSTQEGHVTSHHYEEEKLSGSGDGAAAEEMGVRADDSRIKEEEISPEIGTDGRYTTWNVEEDPVISAPCKRDDDDITSDPPGSPNVRSRHHTDLSSDPSTHEDQSPDSSHPVGHYVAQRPPKLFSCSMCGKYFRSEQKLTSHQKSHNVKKPYSCFECGKSFSYKSKLLSHEAVHKVVKPFSCSECGKSFTQKSNLNVHKTLHTGVKPYSCAECGKCFFNKARLTTHERVHTTDKLYFCSECGKSFSRKSNFMIHRRGHRGENQHSCSECGKIFPSKSELTRHERVHTGEKPYSCSECGKRFSNKRGLVNHQKRHSTISQHAVQ